MAGKTDGGHKYLAESGRGLRLGRCGCGYRISLIHRRGLLAACLSTIVMVAVIDKSKVSVSHRRKSPRQKCAYLNFGFWWQYCRDTLKPEVERWKKDLVTYVAEVLVLCSGSHRSRMLGSK